MSERNSSGEWSGPSQGHLLYDLLYEGHIDILRLDRIVREGEIPDRSEQDHLAACQRCREGLRRVTEHPIPRQIFRFVQRNAKDPPLRPEASLDFVRSHLEEARCPPCERLRRYFSTLAFQRFLAREAHRDAAVPPLDPFALLDLSLPTNFGEPSMENPASGNTSSTPILFHGLHLSAGTFLPHGQEATLLARWTSLGGALFRLSFTGGCGLYSGIHRIAILDPEGEETAVTYVDLTRGQGVTEFTLPLREDGLYRLVIFPLRPETIPLEERETMAQILKK